MDFSIPVTIIVVTMIGLSANAMASNVNAQNISDEVIKGGITSLQNDVTDNNTTWIAGGVYRLDNASSDSPVFNATFYTMKTDGTASHSHQIYDLVLNGQPVVNDNSTTLNGTSTVTMRDGPVTNIPTNVTLIGDTAMSIWLDPSAINDHFGDTPIYGTQDLKCVDSPEYCK